VLHIRQQGNQLAGTHQGEFIARECSGNISGDEVRIASSVSENHGAAMSYRFEGKLDGDTMSGNLDLGEYLSARWTARRHVFGGGRG
jgi:L-seryl-tRNA(Ser) seleniumtransferase